VRIAHNRGFVAFTPEEFKKSSFNKPQYFESILLAHVAEHMHQKETIALLEEYLYLLKHNGKLIIITPQEAGYRQDPTHVEFVDFAKLRNLAQQVGFTVVRQYSFPLPCLFGHFLYFNEFISVSIRT